jgi:hypothetical protein
MKRLLTLPPSPALRVILPTAGSMSAFILLMIIAHLA